MGGDNARLSTPTLRDLGEDALVARLIHDLPLGGDVIAGAGDDCAVLESPDPDLWELLKTDCVVEGVHFFPGTPGESVGWKALCRAVSDIAAMGGVPRAAVVTLVAPPDRPVTEIEAWFRGLAKAARAYGVSVVGGETSAPAPGSDSAMLSITLTGWVEKDRCVFRHGARPGDEIFVTGVLGRTLSWHHLHFRPRLEEARWLVHEHRPVAMMDLSDGLARDLRRLAQAGGVGFRIETGSLPCRDGCSVAEALGDGEEYELLFCLPTEEGDALLAAWSEKFPGVGLSRIGRVTTADEGFHFLDAEGECARIPDGWGHFSH